MSIIPRKFSVIVSPMFKSIPVLALFASVAFSGVALAETTHINLPVATKQGESYSGLLARASKLAEETIERRFQNNKAADQVNLLVTAENEGDVAPILSVNVSRQDWQGNPNIQRWSRVLPFSKDLLGFGSPRPASSPASPPPPPTANSPAGANPPKGINPPATGTNPPNATNPANPSAESANPPNAKAPANSPIVPPFPNDAFSQPITPPSLPDQRLDPRSNPQLNPNPIGQ